MILDIKHPPYTLGPIVNVIEFENLRFRPSTHKRKNGVLKKPHSGERFWKPTFSVAENAVCVRT